MNTKFEECIYDALGLASERVSELRKLHPNRDFDINYHVLSHIESKLKEGVNNIPYRDLCVRNKQQVPRIFLGGTCADTHWREDFIKALGEGYDYFNPVVEDWTEECQKEEERQKEQCLIHLYTITPQMKGVFSIAEIIESAHHSDKLTLICFFREYDGKSFSFGEWLSLMAVKELAEKHGAVSFDSLKEMATFSSGVLDAFKNGKKEDSVIEFKRQRAVFMSTFPDRE